MLGGDDGQLYPPRPGGLSRGIDRVVDKVPHDGQHLANVADRAPDMTVVHDAQPHVAFVRQGDLRQEQGHKLGVLDAGLQPLGQVRAGGGDVGHELDRLVVAAQLNQPDQGMQTVGELMRLGAQRLGQADRVVQLPLQRLGFGPVLERDYPAEVVPLFMPDGHPVRRQHAVAPQHEQVAALDLAGHHVGEPARRDDLAQRAAHEVRGQAQQLPGEIVGQNDPLVLVVSEHALPDAVQHRLPFLEQRRDLAELKAKSLPLEPTRQAQRGEHANRENGEEVGG